MAEKAKIVINYRKLFYELMLVLTVLFIITVAVLYPFLKQHGAFDPYSKLRKVVTDVESYDYNNGRDAELEKDLDEKWNNKELPQARRFYYGLASAVYYCNIGYYNSSEAIFNELYNIEPEGTGPKYDLEVRDVFCDRKMIKNKEGVFVDWI